VQGAGCTAYGVGRMAYGVGFEGNGLWIRVEGLGYLSTWSAGCTSAHGVQDVQALLAAGLLALNYRGQCVGCRVYSVRCRV
jgi:hypothetical protein